MTYVIALPCVDLKDRACIDECPVDCIYEGDRMLYIHPDECVDCGACEPVCPVEAIYYEDDLPERVDRLLQGQRRVLRRARLAGRRRQGRRHRRRPPRRRRASAAGVLNPSAHLLRLATAGSRSPDCSDVRGAGGGSSDAAAAPLTA